jgi:hypothetical protein
MNLGLLAWKAALKSYFGLHICEVGDSDEGEHTPPQVCVELAR